MHPRKVVVSWDNSDCNLTSGSMANSDKSNGKVMLWSYICEFSINGWVGKKDVTSSPSLVTNRKITCCTPSCVKTS
jgi:hypothetical protein